MAATSPGLPIAPTEAPHTDYGEPTGKIKAGLPAAALFVFAVLLVLFIRLARTVPFNSDTLSAVLEGNDIRHGNILLRGWSLSSVTFYTTDLWLDSLALALRGFSPSIAHIVPAFIYALVTLTSLTLASRGRDHRFLAPGLLLCFALIGLPSAFLSFFVFASLWHIGTLLEVLLAFLCLDRVSPSAPSRLRLIGYTFFLASALIGDNFALVIGVLPVLAVGFLRLRQAHLMNTWLTTKTPERSLIVSTFLAVVAARLFSVLVHLLHGYHLGVQQGLQVVPLSAMGHNFALAAVGILRLFHADIFGQFVNVYFIGLLLHAIVLGIVGNSILKSVRGLGNSPLYSARNEGDEAELVPSILGAGCVILLCAYLFSAMPEDLNSTRYLVPVFVYGTILASRIGLKRLPHPMAPWAIAALLLLTNTVGIVKQLRAPTASLEAAPLTQWLLSHHLAYGYGDYWAANSTTVESNQQVKIRSVQAKHGLITPYSWESKASWYTHTAGNFLVIPQVPPANEPHPISIPFAVRAFGPPVSITQVGPWEVLVWNKDITPEIAHAP